MTQDLASDGLADGNNRPSDPDDAAWQRHLSQIADGAADGIVVCDGDCRIVHANPAAERVFGMSKEDLLGRYCDDPAWTVAHAGQPLEREELACHKALSFGETVHATERTLCREDGSSVEVLVSAAPLQDDHGGIVGVVTSFTDVSELKSVEASRRESAMYRDSLLRLYALLGQANSHAAIVDALQTEVPKMLGYSSVWLCVLSDDLETVRLVQGRGTVEGAIDPLMNADERFRDETGEESTLILHVKGDVYLEEIVAAGHIVVVEDARTDPRTDKQAAAASGNRTIVNVPLALADRKLGVFGTGTFGDEGVHPPTLAQLEYLGALANHVAVAMDRVRFLSERRKAEETLARTLDEVESALDGIVRALASTTGERDPYTSAHQERVARLACAIAERMGLSAETIEGIRIAGMLHDIGKVAIPSEILSKPGALSAMEVGLIREHCRIGHSLLDGVPFHAPVAEIVLQHHERLDGSGYPDGLSGDDILVEARILAVADVVEAMASHRPYRPALGLDAAITEIQRGADTEFDGKVVDACVALLAEQPSAAL